MIDWASRILCPKWLRQLDRMTARRFIDDTSAAEATTFVIEQLSADNWKRCHAFSGACRPETWLHSLAANLIEEFARKRYGRLRPPAWLAHRGATWLSIWRALCLERQPQEVIIDRLCRDGAREPEQVQGIIRTVKARLPWCGISQLPIPAEYIDDDGETVSMIDHHYSTPSAEEQLIHALEADTLLLLRDIAGFEPAGEATPRDLGQLRARIQLADDERLLLKLHFEQGLSTLAIARLLGVPSHQPGRQIRRLLVKLRRAFDAVDRKASPIASSATDPQ